MASLPAGFNAGTPSATTVEGLALIAAANVMAAGTNQQNTFNESSSSGVRTIQLYPQNINRADFQGWTCVLRLSTNLAMNWAGSTNRIWTQIDPIGGTTTNMGGWTFPAGLTLTNWERVFHWCAQALQAAAPEILAPERGNSSLRAVTSTPVPVEWSGTKSWRMISRLSLPLANTWQTGGLVAASQVLTAAAIPTAFNT
jgi:hypothetical protein